MSAGSVHLASVFPRETFRVHCRAQADWIFPVSPVAAGNISTVHSSSEVARKQLVFFPRDIALNSNTLGSLIDRRLNRAQRKLTQ